MELLIALIVATVSGFAGYNAHQDTTCDAAEIAFKTEYAPETPLLGVQADPGGAGYAIFYGSQATGPKVIHLYAVPEAAAMVAELHPTELGQCTNGTGQTYNHYLLNGLPKTAPSKAAMPDL